jgi:hypothetical protein
MSYPEPQPERSPLWDYLLPGIVLTLLAFGIFSTKCNGAEITITEHAPFEYPAKVAEMSDADFFQWATRFNEQQVREIVRSSEPKWLHRSRVRVMRGFRVVEFRPTRYLNPDYFPPSALTVINPYCKPKR